MAGLTALTAALTIGGAAAPANAQSVDTAAPFTHTTSSLSHGDNGDKVTPNDFEDVVLWSGQTGRCLDDSQAYGLRTYPCNGQDYQVFRVSSMANGTWQIRNRVTGACIDDSFQYGLRGYGCNNQSYQDWIPIETNGDYGFGVGFIKNLATGRCMDDSAQYGLRAYPCNESDFQVWDQFGAN